MSKKIIIIGATSGMGRGLAEWYAQSGNTVGATGRRQELSDSLQQKYPQQIQTACFDVTAEDAIPHLQSLIGKMGGVDVLIINAGGGDVSKTLDWELDKRVVAANVIGFVQVAHWTFSYFLQQGHGHLVTISSVAAYRGSGLATAYNAAKAFQSIYFEGLALKAQLLNKKIAVTCIEPGFVATKKLKTDKAFWIVPVDKAVRQIVQAIDRKKRKAYISKRWGLIAFLLKWMPFRLLKKIEQASPTPPKEGL